MGLFVSEAEDSRLSDLLPSVHSILESTNLEEARETLYDSALL